MKIIVIDNLGRDVTHEREWYINADGKIFYYTGDIDGPLYIVDNDYTWEIASSIYDAHYIDKFMYFVNDTEKLKDHKANAERIADAVERTQKYIRKKENYEED